MKRNISPLWKRLEKRGEERFFLCYEQWISWGCTNNRVYNTPSMHVTNKSGYCVTNKLHTCIASAKSHLHSDHNLGLYNTHSDTRRLTQFRLSKILKSRNKRNRIFEVRRIFRCGNESAMRNRLGDNTGVGVDMTWLIRFQSEIWLALELTQL
jgi:hypothetical protein